MKIRYGIRQNLPQFSLQLVQVFLTGMAIGMMRTVVPALAEDEFGLEKQQFVLLVSFVVVFGVVKAIMNLMAGWLADRYGRKKVLVSGWLLAMPVPWIFLFAENWSWVVAATFLLGIQQGLCWSMALNSKLDLTQPQQKGLVNGLNEFFGYAAVALAGILTAWLAEAHGARIGLAWFGNAVIASGLVLALQFTRETRPWAQTAEPQQEGSKFLELFYMGSWKNRTLMSLSQAGLVEKFADALVWIFLPVFLVSQGLALVRASEIIAIYGATWGASQLITGPLSDRIGRKPLIVGGMLLCGLGVFLIPLSQSELLWSIEAFLTGVGMAMLYPTLGSAVADFSPAAQRSTLLGVYRFWRDLGYAIAALAMGILLQWSQAMNTPFFLAAVALWVSSLVVVRYMPVEDARNKTASIPQDPL